MSTNQENYTIATMGSHTALQILKGAKDEGFRTACVVTKKTRPVYEHFGACDTFIEIDDYSQFDPAIPQLKALNSIVIPHGSFVAYLGHERMQQLDLMHYGTKDILEWESDRDKERKWLARAGLRLPRIFSSPDEIDCAVIIKFHGADGGHGYFIANSPEEFYERIKVYDNGKKYVIQEYIVGVPMYVHYFYSPLTEDLEIMSFDKRYESNADSIGRIAAQDQIDADIRASYTITGNIPLVVRESMLPMFYDIGRRVIAESKNLAPKGLYGPFCLEGIVDTHLNYSVFEISARIVAGTNPYVNGSPYTALRYDVPMSTGRRIARDIKEALAQDRLQDVLG